MGPRLRGDDPESMRRMTNPHASDDHVSLDAMTGVLTDAVSDQNEKSVSSHEEPPVDKFASHRLCRG